ncbi:MAG: polysaccharide biosynthesis/export family protein [Acidobacteriota bacterium]
MRRLFLVCLATFTAITAGAARLAAQEDLVAQSYRIGARDNLQIHVEETEELNQEVTVAEDGTISLPLVGTVLARGLTESQLADRLESQLKSRGMRSATVTISVANFRSRPVSILGAVGSPGNHFIPGRATLLEVLMDAGGIRDSHGSEIVVRRRASNGLSAEVRIGVAELIETGDPRLNIPIFAGDLINVPAARELRVHLIGEVGTPGTQAFQGGERATLLTAIARAGGLTDKASRKIRVQRQTTSEEREEILVDFRLVLNNKEPDILLENGDLIIVKESFF